MDSVVCKPIADDALLLCLDSSLGRDILHPLADLGLLFLPNESNGCECALEFLGGEVDSNFNR